MNVYVFYISQQQKFRNKSEEDSDVKMMASLRATMKKIKKYIVIMKEMEVAH